MMHLSDSYRETLPRSLTKQSSSQSLPGYHPVCKILRGIQASASPPPFPRAGLADEASGKSQRGQSHTGMASPQTVAYKVDKSNGIFADSLLVYPHPSHLDADNHILEPRHLALLALPSGSNRVSRSPDMEFRPCKVVGHAHVSLGWLRVTHIYSFVPLPFSLLCFSLLLLLMPYLVPQASICPFQTFPMSLML